MAQTIERGTGLGTVDTGLWWLGWRPLVSLVVGAGIGMILGNGIAIVISQTAGVSPLFTMGAFTLVGAGLGFVGWYAGARRINDAYREVIEHFENGTTDTETDRTFYAILGDGEGSTPLVEASERYDSTYLGFGPSSLYVYEGSLDLVGRTPSLDDGVEIPYEHVASFEYDGSHLVLSTNRGDTFRYPTADEPADVLDELRTRL